MLTVKLLRFVRKSHVRMTSRSDNSIQRVLFVQRGEERKRAKREKERAIDRKRKTVRRKETERRRLRFRQKQREKE